MTPETNLHSISVSNSSRTTTALIRKGSSRLVRTNYNNMSDLKILANYAEIHKEYIILATDNAVGERIKWRFPNGYGASLVANNGTEFRPQLMAIRYSDDLDITGVLITDSSITDTAKGYIHQISVTELVLVLAKIQGLKEDVPK
jgi:hypothetical protein